MMRFSSSVQVRRGRFRVGKSQVGTAEVVAAMAAMGSPETITTGRKFARLVLRVATIRRLPQQQSRLPF